MTRPQTCNHVQPGPIDFPGRCALDLGHRGPHQSHSRWNIVGYAFGTPMDEWPNTEEESA